QPGTECGTRVLPVDDRDQSLPIAGERIGCESLGTNKDPVGLEQQAPHDGARRHRERRQEREPKSKAAEQIATGGCHKMSRWLMADSRRRLLLYRHALSAISSSSG